MTHPVPPAAREAAEADDETKTTQTPPEGWPMQYWGLLGHFSLKMAEFAEQAARGEAQVARDRLLQYCATMKYDIRQDENFWRVFLMAETLIEVATNIRQIDARVPLNVTLH